MFCILKSNRVIYFKYIKCFILIYTLQLKYYIKFDFDIPSDIAFMLKHNFEKIVKNIEIASDFNIKFNFANLLSKRKLLFM